MTKGTRSRQALLDTAITHFATVGRRRASLPAIAAEVGLTPSALYAYFPSKQALWEASVDADAARLIVDAVPDILGGVFDKDFAGVFQRLLRALPAHPLTRRVLSGEEGTGAERLALLPAEVRLHAGLTTALRRGQKDGTIRRDIDADVLAAGLEAIVVGLVITILQTGGRPDPVAFVWGDGGPRCRHPAANPATDRYGRASNDQPPVSEKCW